MFRKSIRQKIIGIAAGLIVLAVITSARLHAHRAIVHAEPNERLPPIRGEQIRLQQVLENLIANAIDSVAKRNGERVLSIWSITQNISWCR